MKYTLRKHQALLGAYFAIIISMESFHAVFISKLNDPFYLCT